MSRRICTGVALALCACGRLGFDGSAIGDGSIESDAQDAAAPTFDPIECPVMRSTIVEVDGVELVVESAATPLVAWRTAAGLVRAGVLDGDVIGTTYAPFQDMQFDRLISAHPIAFGHVVTLDQGDFEMLYAVPADLSSANLRATGRSGVGRSTVTGFGSYVFWGHLATGQPNALLFERLDDDGVPTPQSNRTTGADVRDVAIGGAVASHAHVVWAEADDTCTASELFGGVADLVEFRVTTGCRSPRNASGIGDSLATAYSTPTGALRFHGFNAAYEHDIELSPSAHAPALADDGTVVWAIWFDDRSEGALVLAKIELTETTAIVTSRQLLGVSPTGPDAVAFVGDASPPRLLILEAGAIAVVEPCL